MIEEAIVQTNTVRCASDGFSLHRRGRRQKVKGPSIFNLLLIRSFHLRNKYPLGLGSLLLSALPGHDLFFIYSQYGLIGNYFNEKWGLAHRPP